MSTVQDCFNPLKWRYRVHPPEVIYGTRTHPIIVQIPKLEIAPIDVPETGAQPDPNRHRSLPTGVSFQYGCALLPHPNPGSFIVDLQVLKNQSIALMQNNGYGPFGEGHIIIWDLRADKPGYNFLRVWAHLLKDDQPIDGTLVFVDSKVFKVEPEATNKRRPVLGKRIYQVFTIISQTNPFNPEPGAIEFVKDLLPLYPELGEARYFGHYLPSTDN
jgi:hypothetical protein